MTSMVLAINTAADICSVALQTDGSHLVLSSNSPRKHAHDVLPMVNDLLSKAGITLQQLSAIATVTGPGSFTGLRIGSAVTQGLAFGAHLPVVGVSYLAMLTRAAYHTYQKQLTAGVCMHAREDEYYFACYTDDGTQLPVAGIEDRIVTSREIQLILSSNIDLILTGQGWLEPALASLTESHVGFADLPPPDASVLCELALQALEAGLGLSDPELILPVYLKDEMAYRTA